MGESVIPEAAQGGLLALALVISANAAPVLAHLLLGRALSWPVDGGRCWRDGRRILGASKTWRGLVVSLASTAALSAWWLGDAWTGLLVAALAMAGDLASSFAKRRRGLRSGADAPGLDQRPESLLPLLALRGPLALGAGEAFAVALAFLVLDLIGTRLLAGLRARRAPPGA
jgi:CDP-2,3-bis-(O-geranylgeranyl)-sn-glycerol synthase